MQTVSFYKIVLLKMTPEMFCLRWNDLETDISDAFRELRDVTLACDDNQIKTHKVIMSACSSFFRNILCRNPHQHPLIYLKGVPGVAVSAELHVPWRSKCIAQDELNSFLAVAEDLRVKGLTQDNHCEMWGKYSSKARNNYEPSYKKQNSRMTLHNLLQRCQNHPI